jgi:hypothetical protein
VGTYNHAVRKLVVSSGAVATVPSSAAGFTEPTGVALDTVKGLAYIVDFGNHTVRKLTVPSGSMPTSVAGLEGSDGSADGSGSAARFNGPRGITLDAAQGFIFIVEWGNHTVRKLVVSSGAVTTVAGLAGVSGSADGSGSAARFKNPIGITLDVDQGVAYIADTWNHAVRKLVVSSRAVTTVAGLAGFSGIADGSGSAARFNAPMGIALDLIQGVAFLTDTYNHAVRKLILASGAVTTVAGLKGTSGSADSSDGAARFNSPRGIVLDTVQGVAYIVDSYNHVVRKMVLPCGLDTRYSETGTGSCKTCGAGSYTKGGDEGTHTSCSPCPKKNSKCDGSSVPTKCLAGQTSTAGSSACEACPEGSYRGTNHDDDDCKHCADGWEPNGDQSGCVKPDGGIDWQDPAIVGPIIGGVCAIVAAAVGVWKCKKRGDGKKASHRVSGNSDNDNDKSTPAPELAPKRTNTAAV